MDTVLAGSSPPPTAGAGLLGGVPVPPLPMWFTRAGAYPGSVAVARHRAQAVADLAALAAAAGLPDGGPAACARATRRGAGDGGGDAVARYGTSTWWSPSRFRWLSPAWRAAGARAGPGRHAVSFPDSVMIILEKMPPTCHDHCPTCALPTCNVKRRVIGRSTRARVDVSDVDATFHVATWANAHVGQ
ncbi:hypothetical protein [Mycobacterium kansasii]|uniref:hypothetical protein n=1 Tax=Mycobacterium kansasii TaxID=1768 RepID=UPI002806346A|nr:hypothetical protein [Mycobacterium kansasii]